MPAKKRYQEKITTDNFIIHWFTNGPGNNYKKFRHLELIEKNGAREVILEPLTAIIFIHHNDPEEFKQNLQYLGYPEVARELDRRPRDENIRKGNFGEILASEYLRQKEGYLIPVYRLRYSQHSDASPPGDDVLAFKLDQQKGSKKEICIAEVKVRNRFSSEAVKEAYEKIDKSYSGLRPRPKSLLFVISILRKEKKDDIAEKLLNLLNRARGNPFNVRYIIFLITGNKPRNPFGAIESIEKPIRNLTAMNLTLNSLTELVNTVFERRINLK
jgi:hypothetical protein